MRDCIIIERIARSAISRLINCNCGSRTAVGVLSLACPRESTQREGHPGRGAAPIYYYFLEGRGGPLRSSGKPRASRTRRRAKDNSARSGSNIVSRHPAASLAVLGLLYGEGTAATTLFRNVRVSSVYRSQRKYRFELVAVVGSPYGALECCTGMCECRESAGCAKRPSQGLGKSPKGSGHGLAAPEPQYRDVLWLGAGPKPEKRKKCLRHPGGLFFCVLFFGQAKKSTPTAVREPQLQFINR